MSQRAIHINLEATDSSNIRAEDDAAWINGILGGSASTVSCILPYGDRLSITKINNNRIKVSSGIFAMQGFCIKIPDNELFSIDNGSQGKKRIDLIVAEYRKDIKRDSYEIKVIKGESRVEAVAKDLLVGDLHFGGSVRQEEIGRVLIDGTEIISVAKTAREIDGLSSLKQKHENIMNGTLTVAKATNADRANLANRAINADNATKATNANKAINSDFATKATNADRASLADNAHKLSGLPHSSYVKTNETDFFIKGIPGSPVVSDFNSMKSAGVYLTSAGAVNTPPYDHTYGFLVVYVRANQVFQYAHGYSGAIWYRVFNNTWSKWGLITGARHGTETPTSLAVGEIYVKY